MVYKILVSPRAQKEIENAIDYIMRRPGFRYLYVMGKMPVRDKYVVKQGKLKARPAKDLLDEL